MKKLFLTIFLLTLLAFGAWGVYYVWWFDHNITWEGDQRYTITIYAPSKEVTGPRWYPITFTDVVNYKEDNRTLVFQTTQEVVYFKGIYTIGTEELGY